MITIYGMLYCPFTKKAIKLCEDNKLKHEFHEVTDDELIQLKDKWNHPTIPIIVKENKKIGGFTELNSRFQRNEL